MSDAPQSGGSQGLAAFCPGLALLRGYRREWLAGDVIAGVTVCVVMIPSAIAYSALMGIAPQHGLYAALVSMIVYAVFGSSRQMIAGPDIAISLLIASAIAPLASGDEDRAAALVAAVALLSGVLLLLASRARVGKVAEFLSKPVLVGYMTGAALILMASQLDRMFGVPLKNRDFFPRVIELAGKLGATQWLTLGFGLAMLALRLALARFVPKVPAPLVVCVVSVALCDWLGLESRGITVVGSFPRGLPALVWPGIGWRETDSLMPVAISVALLAYAEGVLLARAFASKNGYTIQPNQELRALGLTHLAVGLFQGFSTTGSQSQTTINDAAGGKTPLSSFVAAGTTALFLLFLTPLIARLPVVALAALLIYAGFGLVEFDAMFRIYRYYPYSAGVAALTTLSVLAAGVVPGILFGVALSLLGLIERVSNPPDAVLSEVPGHGFHDLGNNATQTLPGLVAYRFYAPLLFPNASRLSERVLQLTTGANPPIRWFLLDAQAISDIDDTAEEELKKLREQLKARGVELKVAHANPPLRSLLERTGLAAEIGPACFFSSVHECVEQFEMEAPPAKPAAG